MIIGWVKCLLLASCLNVAGRPYLDSKAGSVRPNSEVVLVEEEVLYGALF